MERFSLMCWVAAALAWFGTTSTGAAQWDAAAWRALPAEPALLVPDSAWPQIRSRAENDEVGRKIFSLVRARAEALLAAPAVEFVDRGGFWHGPMRQIQGRIVHLALTYRLTGDGRFLAAARREMKALAALPHWFPKHFLDTGEGCLGMALGLAWLRHDLPAEDREQFETAIIAKALRPSLVEDGTTHWVSSRNNWNPVCHAGLSAGALMVAHREPELAQQIVQRAVRNVGYAGEIYAPAGAYSEGPGYWAYGTTFYALLAEMLRTAIGTTCGLEQTPGYLTTADYIVQTTAPTGGMYNFADAIPDFGFEPVMFWFARELRRRDLAEFQFANLDRLHDYLVSDTPRHDASRLLPLALVWWDETLPATRREVRPLAWWSEGGPQPQAVMRSAWNDRRAVFVGMKAGKVDDSHAHMDVGSFILEADGVRWAVDLGRDSYTLARANGIGSDLFNNSQASKRWMIFRNGPDAHNLLRFGDALQDVTAKAEMRSARNLRDGTGFVTELTPVYRAHVAAAARGISLRPDRSVLIQDEWEMADQALSVGWQWLTTATVTLEGRTAVLRQGSESLRIIAAEPADARFTVEDVSKPRNRFDSANPGLFRLSLHTQSPARTKGRFVVLVVPGSSSHGGEVPAIVPLAAW